MCSIKRTVNNKTRKDTYIHFHKDVAVHGSEIQTKIKKQETNSETAEVKFMRSVAGYTSGSQIRNTKLQKN
jgi:hypothetical protein